MKRIARKDLPIVGLLTIIGIALRDLPAAKVLTKTSPENILIINLVVRMNHESEDVDGYNEYGSMRRRSKFNECSRWV